MLITIALAIIVVTWTINATKASIDKDFWGLTGWLIGAVAALTVLVSP